MAKYTDESEYPKEELLTKRVKAYLDDLPYYYGWKASDRFHPGVSDFIGCYYGTFVGIELKAEKGKPTELQLMFIANITVCGGYGIVCSTMGQLKAFLEYVKEQTKFRLCVKTDKELAKVIGLTNSMSNA